jgi:hypothetical protein
MTEIRKGLTWSRKWHIVDETRSARHAGYDVALCSAHLYSEDKERHRGRSTMPVHLVQIINGEVPSAGECKLCNKKAGRKTVEQLLEDDEMAVQLAKLIYNRSGLVEGDADDLAWDIMNAIREAAG